MPKKTMIQFCLLVLIFFVTFFGFQITSGTSSHINQADLFTENGIDDLLLERNKLIKSKTAYALELCKAKIDEAYSNKINTYQVLANSPTSVVMSINNEKDEIKLHCSISYDTKKVINFHLFISKVSIFIRDYSQAKINNKLITT